MVFYYCTCCHFETNHRSNYQRHLGTTKHEKKMKSQQKVNIESSKSQHFDENVKSLCICKYCNKSFSSKQSMYRHIKYSCKKNNDEDLKELVRLLNEQNKEFKMQNEKKDQQIYEMLEQSKTMQKQIDK